MRLNTIKPAAGAHKIGKRVGRGIGSGLGKTCGRGHKGQKSRAGGFHKSGFEGGQMPLQRRLPKFGFHSPTAADCDEIRLHEIDRLAVEVVNLAALQAAHLVNEAIKRVRVIKSGAINRAVIIRGLTVTKGARAAIEAAGGKVEA